MNSKAIIETRTSVDQYTAEWHEWHDARLSALATPFGWLSLTGLTWLDEGETTAWEGGPGTFVRDGEWVHFTLAPGTSAGPGKDALEIMGRPGPAAEVRVDSDDRMSARVAPGESLNWILVGHVLYELLNRDGSIGLRRHDSKAPLLSRFIDVPTFPVSQDWVVRAAFTPYPQPEPRRIASAMPGIELDEQLSGEVEFELAGHTHRLRTTGCPGSGLTVRFHDYTNGVTTATWRTLNIGLPDAGNSVILDFNRVYNDPFAFTPYATCPAPVPENILPLAVEAGERRPTQTLSEAGINTPVLVIETSPTPGVESILARFDENGLEVTHVQVAEGEVLPPLAGFAAVVLFGGFEGDDLSAERRAEITELLTDVMATRLPVVGGGSAAQYLTHAAAHDTLTAGRLTFEGTPADLGRLPLAVSADIADDGLFRANISTLGSDGIGYIEIDKLADEAPAATRNESLTITWRDLVERFARLVHTNF